MRPVGYLRVSTDAQVERGLGLEVQEHAIRSWVQERGHELVALTRDEGISGSNSIDTRLGLDDALEMIRRGTAEAVIVYRLDRLARDLIVQETLLREVWAMGGHVFSTSDAESGNLRDEPDDPSRALICQILGAVAEYERKMIALRLRAGARRKAAAGGYAGGQPPFAWAADGRGALVPVPHEQAILQRMRELRAEGRSFRTSPRNWIVKGFRHGAGDAGMAEPWGASWGASRAWLRRPEAAESPPLRPVIDRYSWVGWTRRGCRCTAMR